MFCDRSLSPSFFLLSTLGFGAVEAAQRFCQTYEEVHHFFRPRQRMSESVSLSARRDHFLQQVDALQAVFEAA